MPGLDPTNLRPKPGDPWRASDHNVVVDQSIAIREAFLFEHGDAGDHATIRFAVAGAVLEWNGLSWELRHSHGIASLTSISRERLEIDLERPMRSAGEWGVIGSADPGGAISLVGPGKTRDHIAINIPSAASLVTIYVVGPHAPL